MKTGGTVNASLITNVGADSHGGTGNILSCNERTSRSVRESHHSVARLEDARVSPDMNRLKKAVMLNC
ncbi:hypothetical protein E2C01_037898 [Portunus trituberculatus]|uniref:Uncharacterized protein n=1 Tax=Portunus trituberculatus TaxID=210409 RepID=A0A5B7FAR7_PORTR|nr:hypothetical protein [Portunus trituberculatus]